MNYTDEQFAALAPFEDNFRTAIDGEWTRRIRTADQQTIKTIYEAATKSRIPFNQGCGTCLLNLLKRAGRLYFADKAEKAQPEQVGTKSEAQVGTKPEAPDNALAKQAQPEPPASPKTPQISTLRAKAGKPSAKSNKGRKSAKK